MTPQDLVAPGSPLGLPAPYALIAFFKVVGFALHMVPMNLWLAGIPLAVLLRGLGGADARAWSDRLMRQMPVLIALGVNFGIVPLLFLQVSYYGAFYPATILMAWPWLSVIALLTAAYYGIYYYAGGLASERMSAPRRAAGWLTAALFVAIGFLFGNAMSLMTNPGAWTAIWAQTQVGGAVLGLALNLADPTLWPRLLLVVGLALTSVAAYTWVDAGWFANRIRHGAWVRRFAPVLYGVGLVWAAAAGAWYAFGTWIPDVREAMFGGWFPLTLATAVSPGLAWLFMLIGRGNAPSRWSATLVGAAQFGTLALNAVSRQVVQSIELLPGLDPTRETVNTQWSPLILFLVLFVLGGALIAWMVRQAVTAPRAEQQI